MTKAHFKSEKLDSFTCCGRYGLKIANQAEQTTCINCQSTKYFYNKTYIRFRNKNKSRNFIKNNLYKTFWFYGTQKRVERYSKKNYSVLLTNVFDENGNFVADHVWLRIPNKIKFDCSGKRMKFKATCFWYESKGIQKFGLKLA